MRSLTLLFFCIFVSIVQFSCTPESIDQELKMELPEEFYGDNGNEETPEEERD